MLEKYNIEAKKLEKTEENNARMRLIEEDAKKPKIEREFSFYNAETLRFTEGYEFAKNNLHKDPLKVLCGGLLYILVVDLIVRFFWQQLSTQNVKPFLSMNIPKRNIVHI